MIHIARSLPHQSQRADERNQQPSRVSSASANSDNGDDEKEFSIELVSYVTTGEPLSNKPTIHFPNLSFQIYTSGLSYHEFSNHVQRKIEEGLQGANTEVIP